MATDSIRTAHLTTKVDKVSSLTRADKVSPTRGDKRYLFSREYSTLFPYQHPVSSARTIQTRCHFLHQPRISLAVLYNEVYLSKSRVSKDPKTYSPAF